jgi:predicted DNA-binding protein
MSNYTVDARTRLTPEQHAQLTALAERRGMPLAVYIRMVLLEHLDREGGRRLHDKEESRMEPRDTRMN